ncbi:MAG: hypothetical protein D6723_04395 [Acidobacteria bacterium]|nr:MAG: hypothetical protein D6723_04395 [Acidobacteriota bacterium]
MSVRALVTNLDGPFTETTFGSGLKRVRMRKFSLMPTSGSGKLRLTFTFDNRRCEHKRKRIEKRAGTSGEVWSVMPM